MFIKNRITRWVLGGILLSTIGLSTVYMTGRFSPERKPGVLLGTAQATTQDKVNLDTKIRVVYNYLCGNQENTQMNATPDLLGLDLSQLVNKFAGEDGWTVSGKLPATLVFEKAEWDVCPVHRNYRHLGEENGFLAIFEGPLGVETTLLQKEDIKVTALPLDLQDQLTQARGFKGLPTEKQRQLRENLEFTGDQQINEFLDNLDEFREE